MNASYTLGRGELYTVAHVVLPLSSRGIMAGATLAFARAMGEFGATIMVAGNMPGHTTTMPITIYTETMDGSWGSACGWSRSLSLWPVWSCTCPADSAARPSKHKRLSLKEAKGETQREKRPQRQSRQGDAGCRELRGGPRTGSRHPGGGPTIIAVGGVAGLARKGRRRRGDQGQQRDHRRSELEANGFRSGSIKKLGVLPPGRLSWSIGDAACRCSGIPCLGKSPSPGIIARGSSSC